MIGATADRLPVPGVDDIENQRRVRLDGRMQSRWRLPGPVTDPDYIFTLAPGAAQSQAASVADDNMT
jgi:hypothetical protein